LRGTIFARGGLNGGDGGFVEVSSHGVLDFVGTVDNRAPQGAAGTLLLDPMDVNDPSQWAGPRYHRRRLAPVNIFDWNGKTVRILTVATLQNALNSSNVIVTDR